MASRLPPPIVRAIDKSKILGVRAGEEHRIIGVWVVVVDGRVFARSWGVKPKGWYRSFLENPRGVITCPGRKRPVPVRGRPVRGERLKRAVTEAYRAKYNTPASLKWVRDLARAKSRNATLEFVPE